MRTKIIVLLGILIFVVVFIFGIQEAFRVDKAHQTFENYYAFRGCVHLLKRTDGYGICKTDQGQTIKIVKFNEKWYLDGDLPFCISSMCF